MSQISLNDLAAKHLQRAATSSTGRSTSTVYGGAGCTLGQIVIALTAGSSLSEHENPGEATLQILQGRAQLSASGASWEGQAGDVITIPPARHSLEALEDSVVLLTFAKR